MSNHLDSDETSVEGASLLKISTLAFRARDEISDLLTERNALRVANAELLEALEACENTARYNKCGGIHYIARRAITNYQVQIQGVII